MGALDVYSYPCQDESSGSSVIVQRSKPELEVLIDCLRAYSIGHALLNDLQYVSDLFFYLGSGYILLNA